MTVIEFLRSGGPLRLAKYLVEKVLECVPRRHPKLAQLASRERVSAHGSPRQPGGSKSIAMADRVAPERDS